MLWGELDEGFGPDDGPLDAWRRWTRQVEGQALPCGHFIPEEASDELIEVLECWLA